MNDRFEQLLLSLTESLVDSAPWEVFLQAMESYFDCQNAALFLRSPTEEDTGMLVSQKAGIAEASAIVETFFDSPFLHLVEQKVWLLQQEATQPLFQQRYERYLDYHRGRNTTDIMALNLVDPDTEVAFYFRLVRYSHHEPFQQAEVDAMRRLVPHLQRAVAIYSRLLSQKQQIFASDHTTASLGIGYLVLATDRTIQLSNSVAAAMIKEKRGIAMVGEKLSCTHTPLNKQLLKHLQDIIETVGEESVVFELPCSNQVGDSLSLIMRRLEVPPELRDEDKHFVSVIIHDQKNQTAPSAEAIAQQFNLTPAEAQLAQRLVMGDSLAEAAEQLGRTKGTVRVQLSSVFSKTGAHKQHQLISLILQANTGYMRSVVSN